jgi:hypothetical protein|nr:MAG TPA: hypothetical protein [Caudoviricetes sp.]
MSYIQESILSDIINVYDNVTADDFSLDKLLPTQAGGYKSFKSINSATKDLVLTFPVMFSRNMELATAELIAKALEAKYANLVKMLLTAMAITNATDAIDYVKNIHSNMQFNNGIDVDDYLTINSKLTKESGAMVMFTPGTKAVYENYKHSLKHSLPIANQIISEADSKRDENKSSKSKDDKPGSVKFDQDAKLDKANQQMPLMMKVNFISKATGRPITTSAYLGIKCKLFDVAGLDIIQRIVSKNSSAISLFNFIRATSQEIGFWRDFVFALSKAKVDAISNARNGSSSKMWKALEQRATKSKLNQFFRQKNDATAITSLLVTTDEVEELKKNNDIDLSRSNVARKIMSDYNLLCIGIVDETTESVALIFDTGDDEYELVRFKSLKKDKDMDAKQIVNLLTKMA